jgi:hypothetical protein
LPDAIKPDAAADQQGVFRPGWIFFLAPGDIREATASGDKNDNHFQQQRF